MQSSIRNLSLISCTKAWALLLFSIFFITVLFCPGLCLVEEKVHRICDALGPMPSSNNNNNNKRKKEIKTIILVNLLRIQKCRVGFLSIYNRLCTAVASVSYLYFLCAPVFNLDPHALGKAVPFQFHFETGAELPS